MIALFYGILLGTFFGFVLQKGGVSKFNVIVRQFLLKDFTVAQIMIYAIIYGGMLFYGSAILYKTFELPLREGSIYGAALGGLIFGLGMAIYGYCPGTGMAALGEGSLDALFGIFGMFFGAALFEYFYSFLFEHVLQYGITRGTIFDLLNISPFIVILFISLVVNSLIIYLKKKQV